MWPGIAGLSDMFLLSIVPAVPWNYWACDVIPKPAGGISHLSAGIWAGFWQNFDHKNVPAVLGIYTGFA